MRQALVQGIRMPALSRAPRLSRTDQNKNTLTAYAAFTASARRAREPGGRELISIAVLRYRRRRRRKRRQSVSIIVVAAGAIVIRATSRGGSSKECARAHTTTHVCETGRDGYCYVARSTAPDGNNKQESHNGPPGWPSSEFPGDTGRHLPAVTG